jgi:ABC transporter with metal-binding/Fe-S-binding domain ATP-binding protein
MKLASLFSGGKDSMMALYKALREGHDVLVLLSMISGRDDSYMYHVPNINLTKYQAEAIGLPLVSKETSGKPPAENKDLEDALSELKNNFKIQGVSVGAVHSNYQYKIVDGICKKLNLTVFAPYWQHDHGELIEEAIDSGFEIVIVGAAAYGMDESWLGRRLDKEALLDLKKLNRKFGVDVGGEGGEYETFVTDGPVFSKRIKIVKSRKAWDGKRGELVIENVELIDK